MEKSLKLRKQINEEGKETLMDRIQGPADTEFVSEDTDDDNPDKMQAPRENPETKNDKEADGYSNEEIPQEIDVEIIEDEDEVEKDGELDEMFKLPEDSAGDNFVADDDLPDHPEETNELDELEPPVQDVKEIYPMPQLNEPLGADDEPPLWPEETAQEAETTPDYPEKEEIKDESVHAAEIKNEVDIGIEPGMADTDSSVPVHEQKIDDDTGEPDGVYDQPDNGLMEMNLSPNDFMILFETGKEIMKASKQEEIYDVLLFSIMGQIGTSSSSILVPDKENPQYFKISDFRGITLKDGSMKFNADDIVLCEVFNSKSIIDLEKYKDSPDSREEYFKYISIDARILVPIILNEEKFGVLAMGEKIIDGEYTKSDEEFLLLLCEVAAIALKKMEEKDRLETSMHNFDGELELYKNMFNSTKKLMDDGNLETARELFQSEFADIGIQSYAVFSYNVEEKHYSVLCTEKEDFLAFRESRFVLDEKDPFIKYLRESKEPVQVDNVLTFNNMYKVFNETQLVKISTLSIYPFRTGNEMLGFVMLFRVSVKNNDLINNRLPLFLSTTFPYLLNIQRIDSFDEKYIDNIRILLNKINLSIDNAGKLGIPLTLAIFSVKNFNRYYSLYGYDDAEVLINKCRQIILSRISDSDYVIRIDRNKILMVLPGKDRKYTIPLANTIRNEIVHTFEKKEMQLMLVYLTAEYPEDGKDVFNLLDALE